MKITFRERFKNLIRREKVTNKQRMDGVIGMAYVNPYSNPNYKDLSWKDSRNDEVFEREYITTNSILVDLDQRLRTLEKVIKK